MSVNLLSALNKTIIIIIMNSSFDHSCYCHKGSQGFPTSMQLFVITMSTIKRQTPHQALLNKVMSGIDTVTVMTVSTLQT